MIIIPSENGKPSNAKLDNLRLKGPCEYNCEKIYEEDKLFYKRNDLPFTYYSRTFMDPKCMLFGEQPNENKLLNTKALEGFELVHDSPETELYIGVIYMNQLALTVPFGGVMGACYNFRYTY